MNKSKAKGTAGETAIVNFLKDEGLAAYRNTLSGSLDKGDITISLMDHTVIVEAKNEKKMTLSEYVDEALAEAKNADADFGVAWHKRRGKGSPGDWYVTMDGKTLVRMLKELKKTHTVIS